MVYILLSKENSVYQNKIIDFVRENIKFNNINYKLIFNPKFIIEKTLDCIQSDDILIWHSMIAHNNLELVKNYKNSIVILEQPTILLQKISDKNYVNENMAINNGFYLIYMNPERDDITNNEWKLVVEEEQYLMTINDILELSKNSVNDDKIIVPDVFDDIINFVKIQTNLS